MFTTNNYIIILLILSIVIFYLYISVPNFSIEKMANVFKKDAIIHNLPTYSTKDNYNDIIDIDKKKIKGQVVKHDTYNKLTFTDKVLDEFNVIMVPIISKINTTFKTKYNMDYIDYKDVQKKTDKMGNSLYTFSIVIFQRGSEQKELVFEIFKDTSNATTINNIIDQKKAYKLYDEDKYNASNIYTDSSTNNLPIIPKNSSCSLSYPSTKIDMTAISIKGYKGSNHSKTEHFDSRIRDFDSQKSQNIKNKNIEKISKYYNLTNQLEYPAIEKNLFNRHSTEIDSLQGHKDISLPHSKINFKVNQFGIQDMSYSRNAWFVDRESAKGITKVYPNNKLSNKWDTTGTTIPESNKECDIADGIDYACETREKIPNHHPAMYSYYGNNNFKNNSNKSNMFSLLNNSGNVNHLPM